MIIMGIDPGFAIVGFGVIKYVGNKFSVLDCGAITTKASVELPLRLCQISDELEIIMAKYKPDAIIVEELFFNKNIKTALSAAHGRGVIMLSAARSGAKVYEYTPLQVKQAVAGYGRADKTQIQQMVKVILNLQAIPKPDDVADALAIAICHAHSHRMVEYGVGSVSTGWDKK